MISESSWSASWTCTYNEAIQTRHLVDDFGDDLHASATSSNDADTLSFELLLAVVPRGMYQFAFEVFQAGYGWPLPIAREGDETVNIE